MHYYLPVLFFLAAFPFPTLTIPLASRWVDMRVRHFWDVTPHKWGHLSTPSDSTPIDLRISLKPHHENALIEALYEVSSPNHPKHVSLSLLRAPIYILTSATASMQVSLSPVPGSGRRACRTPLRNSRARYFLARTPRGSLIFHLDDTRRQLVESHWRVRVSGQPTPRRVIPALSA